MSTDTSSHAGMKLVDESSGVGRLRFAGRVVSGVRYQISRFQGMTPSGLPVPGLHRIDGKLDLRSVPDAASLVGTNLTLEYEDGRSIRVTVADADGRVLTEGHGPARCLCC